jgi:hypothetical protein
MSLAQLGSAVLSLMQSAAETEERRDALASTEPARLVLMEEAEFSPLHPVVCFVCLTNLSRHEPPEGITNLVVSEDGDAWVNGNPVLVVAPPAICGQVSRLVVHAETGMEPGDIARKLRFLASTLEKNVKGISP